jgi:hypothetical protein
VAKATVSIYISIGKLGGKQQYCPALWETEIRLKDFWYTMFAII